MDFIIVVTYLLILHIREIWALQLHYFPQYCRFYCYFGPNRPHFCPRVVPSREGSNMKSGYNYQGRMYPCLKCSYLRFSGTIQSKTAKIDYFPSFLLFFLLSLKKETGIVIWPNPPGGGTKYWWILNTNTISSSLYQYGWGAPLRRENVSSASFRSTCGWDRTAYDMNWLAVF